MAAARSGKRVRLGEGLDDLVTRRSRANPEGLLQAKVSSAWREVAGEEIDRHTRGLGISRGELRVHVDSHAWAAQLAYMAEELKERLDSVLGEGSVRSIRFTVSRVVGDERVRAEREREAERRYGGERVEPVPLTAEERAAVEREVAGVKSDALREAAVRARVRDLEWKKGREAASGRLRPPEGS